MLEGIIGGGGINEERRATVGFDPGVTKKGIYQDRLCVAYVHLYPCALHLCIHLTSGLAVPSIILAQRVQLLTVRLM